MEGTYQSTRELILKFKKFLEKGHLEKLRHSDQNFMSPMVITVKQDQTIKKAFDSKILKCIHKIKYQIPKIDRLTDFLSPIITKYRTESSDKIVFSTKDLKYAYSQLNLHTNTAKHL